AFALALLPAGDLVLAGAEERADVDGVAAQQDAFGGGERFQGGVPGRQNARCGANGGLGGCHGSLATDSSARYPAPPVNVRTPCTSNVAATVTGSTGRPDTDSDRIAAKISRCPSEAKSSSVSVARAVGMASGLNSRPPRMASSRSGVKVSGTGISWWVVMPRAGR